MTLVSALTTATANQRIVSPLFCGSHPYLHGSLTSPITFVSILPLKSENVKVNFSIKTVFSSIIELERRYFYEKSIAMILVALTLGGCSFFQKKQETTTQAPTTTTQSTTTTKQTTTSTTEAPTTIVTTTAEQQK